MREPKLKRKININLSNKKSILILAIIFLIFLVVGTSYSLLRSSNSGENLYVMNVGLLEVTFVDSETSTLTLENAKPVTDEEGKSNTNELVFTVKNTGNVIAKYNVYIEETSTSPEFKTVIRFISNKNDTGYTDPKTLADDKYIDQSSYLNPSQIASYKVKAWLNENADATYNNQTFTARIVIESFQITEYNTAILGTCNTLIYNGLSQVLVSGGSNVTYQNNEATEIGDYTVTAIADAGYQFDDGSWSKTLTCSIQEGTKPTLAMSISGETYGSGYKSGATVTVNCDSTSGISSFTVNNNAVTVTEGNNTATTTIDLKTAGTNKVTASCQSNNGLSDSKEESYTIYVYSSSSSKCGTYSCTVSSCSLCGETTTYHSGNRYASSHDLSTSSTTNCSIGTSPCSISCVDTDPDNGPWSCVETALTPTTICKSCSSTCSNTCWHT